MSAQTIPRYDVHGLNERCPFCGHPWFVVGQGSQIGVQPITMGELRPFGNAVEFTSRVTVNGEAFDVTVRQYDNAGWFGTVARYTCSACHGQFDVEWNDGGWFMG